jgi:putative aminopeptidase FrvX
MPADHPAVALLSEFLGIPSPPGREERFAALVREKVAALGWKPETDPAGNVSVTVKGRLPKLPPVVYSAHLDEIGLTVTRVLPDGNLKVDKAGGLYTWKIGERPVDVIGDFDTVPGIVSMGSIHTKKIKDKVPAWEDVRVFTGLSPDRLAKAGVRCGSTAVPAREGRGPLLLGDPEDPFVAAWTFDDRIDVVNLVRLLGILKKDRIKPARTTVVAFTVHEEEGAHGAKVLAHRVKPELFVAVDGCPVLPDLDLPMDGRPGIWSRDAVTHFDQAVVRAFLQAAREAGTEMVPAVFDGAASDASLVYACGGAPRVATVGHIRDNSHGFEIARLASIDNVLKSVVRFAETWEG